jgi:hypothetical protein
MCLYTIAHCQPHDSAYASTAKIEGRESCMAEFSGFRYWGDAFAPTKARVFVEGLEQLSLSRVKMRGRETLRLIGQFGRNVYKYHGGIAKEPEPFTPLLTSIRDEVAGIAGVSAESLVAATVQYYPEGAKIGWHVDDSRYGVVVGLSFGGECAMEFRRVGRPGEVIKRALGHGSVYLIEGRARWEFQHHIPPVQTARYSVTFRTLGGTHDPGPPLESPVGD